MLTTRAQLERMWSAWPGFRVGHASDRWIGWTGRLRPLCQTYRIRIILSLDRDVLRSAILPCNPRVTVEAPLLRGRPESPRDPVPHHYPNRICSEQPVLCLYDPLKFEWLPVDAISETIVPWTIDWLACYEVWLATGDWTGGGRHPEPNRGRNVRRR